MSANFLIVQYNMLQIVKSILLMIKKRYQKCLEFWTTSLQHQLKLMELSRFGLNLKYLKL